MYNFKNNAFFTGYSGILTAKATCFCISIQITGLVFPVENHKMLAYHHNLLYYICN